MTIQASDFTSRVDLDNYVRNECGDDIFINQELGHTISGSAEKLKELNLSSSTMVYGVKVVVTE